MASNKGSSRTPNKCTSPVWNLMEIVPGEENVAKCLGKVVDNSTFPYTITETICNTKLYTF